MKQSFGLTIALIFLIASATSFAGQADTILVHSAIMNKDIKCVVIRPTASTYRANGSTQPSANAGTQSAAAGQRPASAPATRLSVVYLLHGHAGSYAQWPGLAPQLKDKADELNMLLVCPDGGYDSWYFDSPVDPSVRYETFIIKELIPYIDTHYPTAANREHRAITGLSMGGHGGLYLAIRHKDLFGAAGATSGGVDFRPFPERWNIKKDLGTITDHKENWDNYTVNHAVESLHNGELKLIFDCGEDDFFLTVNRQLHQKLLDEKIDHDYYERPGGHNNPYWRNSIDYQLLFFWKYFNGH